MLWLATDAYYWPKIELSFEDDGAQVLVVVVVVVVVVHDASIGEVVVAVLSLVAGDCL
jgi:hypothetical protein